MPDGPIIFVVDDNPDILRAIGSVAALNRLAVESYRTAEDFLASYDPERGGCLLLDFKLPGMDGLQLQQRLKELSSTLPIIMISGYADVQIAVQAMSNGAHTFLEKPCRMEELFGQIRGAIQRDLENRRAARERTSAAQQLSRLTDKEREILTRIASGKSNKQMAAALNISLRAVEDRRSRLMKKLRVRTVAELMTVIQSAGAVS